MKYRADIDGLRAFAVLLVMLFHARLDAFRGGFIGVDVFFVISGYLITSLILEDISRNRFSLAYFYERRMRRIFPALFVVVAVCAVAGFLIFLPRDLQGLGQSIVATSVFLSNVLFWIKTDYFAATHDTRPLLHTWSLSVEEQFYVFIPVLLLWACRFRPQRIIFILSALAIASFATSVWGVAYHPSSAFYLLQSRAWELLLGCLLAVKAFPAPASAAVGNVLSAFGIGLIALSAVTFSPATPFPGVHALVPTVGTALIILAGMRETPLANRMLEKLAGVGLISYSLYLWHWPLLVFARYFLARTLTAFETGLVLLLSLAIAAISWRFVEQPVRQRVALPSRVLVFRSAMIFSTLLVAVGALVHVLNGVPSRFPTEVLQLAAAGDIDDPRLEKCISLEPADVRNGSLCLVGTGEKLVPEFLVWGDSHAGDLMPAFQALANEYDIRGWVAASWGCPPLLGVVRTDLPPSHRCSEFNEAVESFVRENKVKTVVLVAQWAPYALGYLHGDVGRGADPFITDDPGKGASISRDAFIRGLDRSLGQLESHGAKVWIVEQIPENLFDPPHVAARLTAMGRDVADIGTSREKHRERQAFLRSTLDVLGRTRRFDTVSPDSVLCNSSRCNPVMSGQSLYRSSDHLSKFGALQLLPVLRPVFADMRRPTER